MCHFISTSSNVIVSGQFWGGNMRLGALCFLRLQEVSARLSSRVGVGLYVHACVLHMLMHKVRKFNCLLMEN